MTRRTRLFGLFVSVLLLAVVLTGCAGANARQKVLDPVLDSVAKNIVADLGTVSEIDAVAVKDFTDAASVGDWSKALTLWPQVRSLANASIDARVAAGTLGPISAGSLRERLSQFEDKMRLRTGVH